MNKKIIAIVPAAGLGTRFNASVKKTYINLRGIPLFIHTLKRLCDEDAITEIIPVLRGVDIDNGFQMVKEYNIKKIKRIAAGRAVMLLQSCFSLSCLNPLNRILSPNRS